MSPQRRWDTCSALLIHASPFTLTETNRRGRARSIAVAVLAAVAVTGAAACTGTGPTAAPTTTSPPPGSTAGTTVGTRPGTTAPPSPPSTPAPTTTAAVAGDDAQIRQLIDTYWREWVTLFDPPDPNRVTFFSLLTGPALEQETKFVTTMMQASQASRLPPNSVFSHKILRIEIRPETATVFECVIDDMVVVDTRDGTVMNDRVSTNLVQTELTKVEGHWLISQGYTADSKTGVQPCAEP